jgi:hypothetical protein
MRCSTPGSCPAHMSRIDGRSDVQRVPAACFRRCQIGEGISTINPFQSSHQTSQGNERALHSCPRALRQALAAEAAAGIRIALAAVGCGCLTGNGVSLFPNTGSAQCRVRAGRRLARGRSAGCRSADRGHRGTPRSHHHGVVRTVYVEEQHVRRALRGYHDTWLRDPDTRVVRGGGWTGSTGRSPPARRSVREPSSRPGAGDRSGHGDDC